MESRRCRKESKVNEKKIDPVCLMHGKKMSKHTCLYCCLCWKDLTPEDCNITENGKKEDVCKGCARKEKEDDSISK